jgi:shikimate dehydrogenase
VYALVNDGWNINIIARRVEQAEELAQSFTNRELRITTFANLSTFQHSNFQLIINTTPLGMTPNTDQSPLPENLSLPQHVAIYDLIYNPQETNLVRNAHSQGLQATTGIGMLIEQAALAFELWTGKNPPRNIMYASVVE